MIIDNTGVVFSKSAGHASLNTKYVAKRSSQNDGLCGDILQSVDKLFALLFKIKSAATFYSLYSDIKCRWDLSATYFIFKGYFLDVHWTLAIMRSR